jgi:hypothetical protein
MCPYQHREESQHRVILSENQKNKIDMNSIHLGINGNEMLNYKKNWSFIHKDGSVSQKTIFHHSFPSLEHR